jgi:hypothetical protein
MYSLVTLFGIVIAIQEINLLTKAQQYKIGF